MAVRGFRQRSVASQVAAMVCKDIFKTDPLAQPADPVVVQTELLVSAGVEAMVPLGAAVVAAALV